MKTPLIPRSRCHAATKVVTALAFLLTSMVFGATWTLETPSTLTSGRSIRNFWGTSATNLYAVGGANANTGLFYHWNGTVWSEPSASEFTTFPMRAIYGFSATEVWVAGRYGNVRQSTNSGVNWTARNTGLSTTFTPYSMWGATNTDIWLVGVETNTSAGAIYRWNGSTWSLVSVPGFGTQQLQSVWGTAANNVVMVATGGLIARWNGSTVSMETSGTTNALSNVWGLDANNIFAVGQSSTILRYDGSNWATFSTTGITGTVALTGIGGSSGSNLYVSTGDGNNHVYQWNGTTWTRENTSYTSSMNAIWTNSTASNIWAGGANQLIAGTANVSSAPTVTTTAAASVMATTATLGGNITATGGADATERGVVYALTSANSNPEIGGASVTVLSESGTFSTGAFTRSATSLTASSAYSFKAYATNSSGTSYGSVLTFNTSAAPVSVISLNRVNTTPSNAGTVNWTLTFGSAVTGVTASNFSLSGAGATGASVGTPTTSNAGLTWTVPVTTAADGTLTLSLANATGLSATVGSLPYGGQSYTIDKTAPTVVSVVRQTPSGQMTTATSVTFRVTYSEPVTGIAAARYQVVAVNGSNIVGTVAGVTPVSTSVYDVAVSITSGTGEYRLRVID